MQIYVVRAGALVPEVVSVLCHFSVAVGVGARRCPCTSALCRRFEYLEDPHHMIYIHTDRKSLPAAHGKYGFFLYAVH